MSSSSDLPVLVHLRGWNAETNRAGFEFVDHLRGAGVDAVDVYVDPAGSTDLAGWAAATIVEIDAVREPGAPLHLVGYCIGGNLGFEVIRQLELRGDPPAFVAFIDVREDQERTRLERGLDALYAVPWSVRARLLLTRIAPPDREPTGVVVASVLRRAVRSVRELPKRGWRSRKRRDQALFDAIHLTYSWEFERLGVPVHCYNTRDSVHRYGAGDPSMNIGQYLTSGYWIRWIEGTHETCIEPPNAAGLIELIEADRARSLSR